jgi:hypothetical protein
VQAPQYPLPAAAAARFYLRGLRRRLEREPVGELAPPSWSTLTEQERDFTRDVLRRFSEASEQLADGRASNIPFAGLGPEAWRLALAEADAALQGRPQGWQDLQVQWRATVCVALNDFRRGIAKAAGEGTELQHVVDWLCTGALLRALLDAGGDGEEGAEAEARA